MQEQLKAAAKSGIDAVKVTIKLALIFGMLLAFLLPQFLIQGLVHERSHRLNEVTQNVAHQYGGNQLLTGPVLVIPYDTHSEVVVFDGKNNKTESRTERKTAYFLPEELAVESDVQVEELHKSIYEVPVFNSSSKLRTTFVKPDFSVWEIDEEDVHWNDAYLVVSISDQSGISGRPVADFQGASLPLQAGKKDAYFLSSGMHLPVTESWLESPDDITFHIDVRGTEALRFKSLAANSSLRMTSNWPHPNFEDGISGIRGQTIVAYDAAGSGTSRGRLPDHREIMKDGSGFNARWNITQFNASMPMQWIDTNQRLEGQHMGAGFVQLADHYDRTERSVKYMALIVGLVFLTFLISELLKGRKIHPFQYIMVGAAIAIFFLLLLALSEYAGFNLAYAIASIAVILLITLYSLSIFKNKSLAIMLGLLLTGLFVFLFVILQAAEYSLLMGAIGLFVILAAVMFFTRKINWYSSNLND